MKTIALDEPSTRLGRNDALTGLRGLAALFVACAHLANEGLFFEIFRSSGKLGVWIFFILSAYLMTRLYFWRDPSQSMRAYLAARGGRVLPLYWLILGISLLFVGAGYWRYQLPDLSSKFSAFLLLAAPQEMWAVPVEVQFYACFALLWYLFSKGVFRPAWRLIAAIALIAGGCLGVTLLKWRLAMDVGGLNLYMHIFLLGMFAAICEDRLSNIVAALRNRLGDVTLSLLACLLFASCLPELRAALGIHIPARADPFSAIAMFMIFNLVLREIGWTKGLASRPLVKLGEISYGFYLIHHIVITACQYVFPGLGAAVATPLILIVSLALAYASFTVIERPLADRIRAMAKRNADPRSQRPAR